MTLAVYGRLGCTRILSGVGSNSNSVLGYFPELEYESSPGRIPVRVGSNYRLAERRSSPTPFRELCCGPEGGSPDELYGSAKPAV